jgi:copper resistance protein D
MALALILVRWLHLSASILIASLFLFEAAIVFPATKKSLTGTGQVLERSRRLTCLTALWTLLVAIISWVLWSWLVASIMTGDNLIECFQTGDWWTVLAGTQFGHIWLFRVIVNLLLGTVLWVLVRRSGRRSFLQTTLVGLSVLELVSLVGAGHGTASPGPLGIVHLLADALHLLASAFWPGTLVPLAVFLVMLLKSSQVEAIGLAALVVRRFSASSLTAVAGLALTGLVNTIFMVGSLPVLLTSVYGQILVTKLVLFLGMIGFGAWNLFLLKPRIPANPPTDGFARPKSTLRSLLRNVLWEIGLGTVVVLIVGWLGTTPPPTR